MTVYVDDMNLRADVPNGDHVVRGRWSHLYADTEAELRAFAKQLGLRDSWIQHPGEAGVHFDVTSPVRQRAIKAGARPVTWREAGEHMARQRRAGRAHRAEEAPTAEEREERPTEAQRPGEGRRRHSWGETTTDDGQKVCFREGCGMEAEQRWNPATNWPLVIYSKSGQRVVSGRVPPCGSELPGGEISTEERKHLAGAADRQAAEAYRSGDLDRAFRLLTDARCLDPDRSQTWDEHEQKLRASVREVHAPRAERSGPPAEPERREEPQHERSEPARKCNAPNGREICGITPARPFAQGWRCAEHEPRPQPAIHPAVPYSPGEKCGGCGTATVHGREKCQACGAAEKFAQLPEREYRDLSHGNPGHQCVLPGREQARQAAAGQAAKEREGAA